MSRYWTTGLGRYLVRHPPSAVTLAHAGWRLRRRGWWHQAPFLPLPDRSYWDFRVVTANGPRGTPSPESMVDAASWSLRQPVER